VSGVGLRAFIVAASWHDEVMVGLIASAERELRLCGVEDIILWRVPGAFELPLGSELAIESGAEVVIALGAVIRGETAHFDYVCQAATSGLVEVQLRHKVPIGFGLLTVNNLTEALARAGLPGSEEDKGAEAVQAALMMAKLSN
jgi:6,7-dimethyl-8-ribityllumazine synthase